MDLTPGGVKLSFQTVHGSAVYYGTDRINLLNQDVQGDIR